MASEMLPKSLPTKTFCTESERKHTKTRKNPGSSDNCDILDNTDYWTGKGGSVAWPALSPGLRIELTTPENDEM